MDKLYIIMPAYNEQDNIVNVIDQWYPVVEKIGNDSKLVIIDDGSKDNTYKIMSNLLFLLPINISNSFRFSQNPQNSSGLVCPSESV